MAIAPDLFNRGDLITADRLNLVLQKLHELETRLEAVEKSQSDTGTLTVTSFSPANEQRVGRILEILGANFEVPSELNKVTIDGVPVEKFVPGTTRLLRLTVPDLPKTPVDAIVKIANRNGAVSRLYRITPAIQVSRPDPRIDSIRNVNSESEILNLGQPFEIVGDFFGETPGQNTIRLRSREANVDFTRTLTLITPEDDSDPRQRVLVTMPRDIPLLRDSQFPGSNKVRPDEMEIEIQIGASNPVFFPVKVAD